MKGLALMMVASLVAAVMAAPSDEDKQFKKLAAKLSTTLEEEEKTEKPFLRAAKQVSMKILIKQMKSVAARERIGEAMELNVLDDRKTVISEAKRLIAVAENM